MTKQSTLWLLPDGVEELLPAEAQRIENLRRKLISTYQHWGYQLVFPPLVEFLDALLTGVGQDLDLQTFKLTDQISGRMMGVRPDMTPQVARIDSRMHESGQSNRLCYIGSVLRTRAKNQLSGRTPLQSGCELFGVPGLEADIEIISLMLEALRAAEVPSLHLDLAHVGIARRLLELSGLEPAEAGRLFSAWQRKSVPEVDAIAAHIASVEIAELVRMLPRKILALEDIRSLRAAFHGDSGIVAALETLERVCSLIAARYPDVDIGFDLCEMRGYHYHTGLFFAVYTPGQGQALAEGGRYDGVGASFGEHRAATGFSLDLRALLGFQSGLSLENRDAIMAPQSDDPALWQEIQKARMTETVIVAMPGEAEYALKERCQRRFVQAEDGRWLVESWV